MRIVAGAKLGTVEGVRLGARRLATRVLKALDVFVRAPVAAA